MNTSFLIILVVLIIITIVAFTVYYMRKPKTGLEIDQDKQKKADKINMQNKKIVEKTRNEIDANIKDRLKKIDEMLKKGQGNQ